MIPLEFVIAALFIVFGAGFIAGWDGATHRVRRQRRRDRARLTAYERQIDELTDQLVSDQVRVGIDTGKQYAVSRMRSTLDSISGEPT